MERTESSKSVFFLVVFLQLWMAKAASPPTCVDQTLAITADNHLKLFIDGIEVTPLPSANIPNMADSVPLHATAQLIAISGNNEVIKGGFLGSSGTFVTDASWKCSDQLYNGWQGVDFDDSEWDQAYVVREHGDSPWYGIEGIREDALWIWIKPEGCFPTGIITIYCRKSLVGTCQPATTTVTPATTPIQCPSATTTESPTPPSTPPPTTTTTTTPPLPTTTTTTSPPTTTTATPPPPTTTTTTTTNPPTTTTTTAPPPTTTTTTIPPPTTTSAISQSPAPPVCGNQPPSHNSSCSGTGPTCITSCAGLADGDYQSCKGCSVYATCSNYLLTDGRPCPVCLFWDDNNKTCQYNTPTCTECTAKLCSGKGASCIGSCRRRADGDYQSCKGFDVYATCYKRRLYDERPCYGFNKRPAKQASKNYKPAFH